MEYIQSHVLFFSLLEIGTCRMAGDPLVIACFFCLVPHSRRPTLVTMVYTFKVLDILEIGVNSHPYPLLITTSRKSLTTEYLVHLLDIITILELQVLNLAVEVFISSRRRHHG